MKSRIVCAALSALAAVALMSCEDSEPEVNLKNRAYIVSRDSDELTVIDLDRLEIIGRIATQGRSNHMAELSKDFDRVVIDSSATDEAVVVDARRLEVTHRVRVGKHPTHLSLTRDGKYFAIMNEEENSISFLDSKTDAEVKRLSGFSIPHFMRFSRDGRFGYVANIGAHHLTRVDMEKLEVAGHIPLDGFDSATPVKDEEGFADAQVDERGVLYAAHAATGRVLVYDTVAQRKLSEVKVGSRPWVAFAEHPFAGLPPRTLVPNFGNRTVSMLNTTEHRVAATLPGDEEAYGVNFSSLAPDRAFVMNRVRQDVAVVDTTRGEIVERIPLDGNVEIASTTPDGRYIVAAVSSANQVAVIDVQTRKVVKVFEDVGLYPWSVTIPMGQNYCH
ncbi:hypothetical protein [Vitiosangium sp. GDMCC 1.1324]|uniref:YVTN family beta-propeller repeat protein n=1 Tax=Vitiosangium sp. (strain GDMCC 1.1324) TaxID=2138576 RepID=UPI000D486EEF|nr:hypothetical protein [Vitiosangium sp. GDMCC 1.1324]PTL80197.1 hypothetical protein DAT35_29790 [Vitiosangium sp. GDMCC 1.1324]